MSTHIERLERAMKRAAEAMAFEEARRLRDEINLLRGGATPEDAAAADTTGLVRQKRGTMGIGTSQPTPAKTPRWKPPKKPDNMTTGRSRNRRPG